MDRGFRAWATPAGLESFYIKECRTERPKDDLVAASEPYHFYYVHAFDHDGQFLRVQENESLAHLRIEPHRQNRDLFRIIECLARDPTVVPLPP